ncbi:MAG: trypsin-like peptidase domain-containing protein [Bacteroidales bacterium]|nr:trypsin-like peptidase domain-containing protein [Bacteroidales bacterium]
MNKIIIKLLVLILSPLILFSQPFTTKSQWETYFKNKILELDPIEGIWTNSNTIKFYNRYNNLIYNNYNPQVQSVVIYDNGDEYKVYDMGQIASNTQFEMTFVNTANNGIYLMENYYKNSHTTAKATAILTGNGILEFSYELPTAELKKRLTTWIEGTKGTFEHQWIKTFPAKSDYGKSSPASGTGFGISSNGIIVTNFHVIDGAKNIKVRGVNSDYNTTYNAKVIVSDKNNDLALIQIDDYGFTTLGTIPFTIKTGLSGVGENIFVLGYPLRATMGDEIKLTNGIVSSRTGFQGDITSYQISAPVQAGNSGGPLFDNLGNLIGIINAKHGGAENASYAVKSSYLTNLIDLLPSPPKLQTVNSLSGKTLTQQVELAKKFVYIIETE